MQGLDSLYQELILDHAKRPHGKGELATSSARTASHHELNPSCGDEITLDIAVEGDRIVELKWRGDGCSISMAAASALALLINEEQPTLQEANAKIAAFRQMLHSRGAGTADEELLGDAVAFQGVSKFVMRIKCAMLSWVALEADIKQLSDNPQ